MTLSIETKEKINYLRQKGFSIPEIHRELGVAKSSLSRIVRNIEILPEYRERWLQRRNASKIISEKNWQRAEDRAVVELKNLDRQALLVMLSSLYWAEGGKKDFSFTNSDPEMIQVFLSGLREIFEVKNENIKISIRVYDDLKIQSCIDFWSAVVGFNLDGKVSVNVLFGKKVGKLKYGMCRVRVRKPGLILKTIFAINKRILKLIPSHSSMDRTRHS